MGPVLANQPLNDVVTRSVTGIIFVATVALACTLLSQYSTYLFVFFAAACLFEWAKMSGNTWDRYFFSFGYFGIFIIAILLVDFVQHSIEQNFLLDFLRKWSDLSIYYGVIVVFAVLDVLVGTVLRRGQLAKLLLQAFVGLCIALAFLTAAILSYQFSKLRGSSFDYLIYIFLIVWVADTAAYLGGSLIGGPKLAPAISPGKTWSGFISGVLAVGLVTAVLSAYGMFQIVDKYTAPKEIIAVGFAMSAAVAAQIGDLLQSKLKRLYNVKDSGSMLPGHGGFLDRLDSFIFLMLLVGIYIISRSPEFFLENM